jgi:hypothetical protein
MAGVKKGNLTTPKTWNRHFNKWLKRQFWKCERAAGKKEGYYDR